MEFSVKRSGPAQIVSRIETKHEKHSKQTSSAKTDVMEWSQEAIEFLKSKQEEMAESMRKKQKESENSFMGKTEDESSMLDALEKNLKMQQLCLKIASRIMKGDKVPPQDLEYLAQHDPNTFKMAMALRKPKKHPKEWKSVLEDEDTKSKPSGETPSDCKLEAASTSEGSGTETSSEGSGK